MGWDVNLALRIYSCVGFGGCLRDFVPGMLIMLVIRVIGYLQSVRLIPPLTRHLRLSSDILTANLARKQPHVRTYLV